MYKFEPNFVKLDISVLSRNVRNSLASGLDVANTSAGLPAGP